MRKMLMLLMGVLLMVTAVMAVTPTVTWVKPTGSGTARVLSSNSGAQNVLNITVTTDTGWNVTNTSFYYSSDGSSFTLIGNATTATCSVGSKGNRNCTQLAYEGFDTTDLQDGVTYTFRATIYNATGSALTANSDQSSVYIDNTKPVCALLSGITAGTESDRSATVTYTCTNSTSAVIYFGANKYTMTDSDNSSTTCTYDMSLIPTTSYDVYAQCSDGINTTTSSTSGSVTLSKKSGINLITSVETLPAEVVTGGKSSNGSVIAIIVIVLGVWYFFFNHKK